MNTLLSLRMLLVLKLSLLVKIAKTSNLVISHYIYSRDFFILKYVDINCTLLSKNLFKTNE